VKIDAITNTIQDATSSIAPAAAAASSAPTANGARKKLEPLSTSAAPKPQATTNQTIQAAISASLLSQRPMVS